MNSKEKKSTKHEQGSCETQTKTEGSKTLGEIQFLNTAPVNFLLCDAPEAPVLLQIMQEESYKPFLRKGIVGQVVGAGGIGKTHFLTQLALSVATGKKFLEKYRTTEQGYVFLGLGENTNDDIHRLLRKVSQLFTEDQLTTASKHLAVMSFSGIQSSFIDKDRFSPSAVFNELLEQLKLREPSTGWSLIILDPISRFLGSDAETDNAAATRFISLLENVILQLKGNPTILFGHHMSKSNLSNTNTDQTAARGSSALTDGVRWQANLDKVLKENGEEKEYDNSRVTFRVVKSNFTAIPEKETLLKNEFGCFTIDKQSNDEDPTLPFYIDQRPYKHKYSHMELASR